MEFPKMARIGTISQMLHQHYPMPDAWKYITPRSLTSRFPDSQSDLLAFTGYTFMTVETNKISIQTITKHVEDLQKTTHEIHNEVKRSKAVKKKKNNQGYAPLATAILHPVCY